MIKVSVAMVTYGHECFIEQAINSVLEQHCSHEFELLIANDTSPDRTNEIVERIIREHPKGSLITYTRHKSNLGMMENFLWVVNQCKGKYVALCEGDDYWTDPEKLQTQIDFLENNPSYSGCANQSVVLINENEHHLFKENVPDDITINDIIGPRLMHTSTLVFKKVVFDLMNNAPVIFSGDRLLFLCIAISGKLRFFQKSMGAYRIHGTGATSTAKISQIILDLNSIAYLKKIYPKFPTFKYRSYIYATVGLWKNGSILKKSYYLSLSFLLSFSYFPENIFRIFRYVKNRL